MVRILATTFMIIIMVELMPVLKRRLSTSTYQGLAKAVFIFYMLLSLYITLLSRKPANAVQTEFELFRAYRHSFELEDGIAGTIQRFLTEGPPAGVRLVSPELLEGAVLNILLYVPMGYLLPTVLDPLSAKGFWHILFIGFAVSLMTELTQLTFRLGWFEIDDLVNNVAGTFVGMLLFRRQNRKP